MKYIGVTLCLFLNIFTGAFGVQEKVLINQGHGIRKNIRKEHGSFYERVINSPFIVDKSLFIENLLTKGLLTSVNLITFPRRWGKTTNMKMLQLFLNIEFNERGERVPLQKTLAYKLFVKGSYTYMEDEKSKTITLDGGPFLISENKEVVKMYLGQYPVIYLNFLELTFDNYDEFKRSLKLMIINTFQNYEFLIEHFENMINKNNERIKEKSMEVEYEMLNNLQEFKNCYEMNKMDEMIPEACIVTLSELLFEHCGKNVFIMIDEYDYVCNSLYFKSLNIKNDEKEKILGSLSTFMIHTFKVNTYYKCGIVTGIVDIVKTGLFTTLAISTKLNVFSPEINTFYGFTRSEMNILMTQISKFNDAEIKQAELQYNGYYIVDSEGKHTKMYNPFAAVRLVQSKKFGNYWTDSSDMPSLISKMFNLQIFRNEIQTLIIGFNTSSSAISQQFERLCFTLYEYKRIEDIMDNTEIENMKLLSSVQYDDVSDLVLKLLFFTGYLTGYPISNEVARLNLSIPNLELLRCFKTSLENYYATQLLTKTIDLHNLGVKFMKIIDSPNSINLNSFKLALKEFLYTRLDTFVEVGPKTYMEDIASSSTHEPRSNILYNSRNGHNSNEEDCIYANEALLQAILTAVTFFTKCLRKEFDIRLPEQGNRPDLLFINRTNVIIMEVKYCVSASVALEQAKKYARLIYRNEPIFDHVINSNVVFHFISINVNKNKEVHILHSEEKWISHSEMHYSSNNGTHQVTFYDAVQKKCVKNLKTNEEKCENTTTPSTHEILL